MEDLEYAEEPMVRPPGIVALAIQARLISRGVDIDHDIVEMVSASMIDWLENTKEGLDYMSYLQRMDVNPASTHYTYYLKNLNGKRIEKIDAKDIEYRTCCIANGTPLSYRQLEMVERDSFTCSSCGATMNCMSKDWELCSHCLEHSPDTDQVNDVSCDRCSSVRCSWHPDNQKEMRFL